MNPIENRRRKIVADNVTTYLFASWTIFPTPFQSLSYTYWLHAIPAQLYNQLSNSYHTPTKRYSKLPPPEIIFLPRARVKQSLSSYIKSEYVSTDEDCFEYPIGLMHLTGKLVNRKKNRIMEEYSISRFFWCNRKWKKKKRHIVWIYRNRGSVFARVREFFLRHIVNSKLTAKDGVGGSGDICQVQEKPWCNPLKIIVSTAILWQCKKTRESLVRRVNVSISILSGNSRKKIFWAQFLQIRYIKCR